MISRKLSRNRSSVECCGRTDVGRVRNQNEDAFALLPEQGLFLVADGVGGAAAGEAASRIAAEVFPVRLAERLALLRKNAAARCVEGTVRATLQEVNDSMLAQMQQHPVLRKAGMGTTVVLALLWRSRLLLAHLGDSRAYLLRAGHLRRLTQDHSLTAELVRWGKITQSQAEDNPGRSTLLRYLGADEKLIPEFTWVQPQTGDIVLLCTDGLTNKLADETISELLLADAEIEQCCETLISRANEAGGEDNITAVLLHFP